MHFVTRDGCNIVRRLDAGKYERTLARAAVPSAEVATGGSDSAADAGVDANGVLSATDGAITKGRMNC